MAEASRIKLSDIQEPVFIVTLKDGTEKSYDPFELMERVEEKLGAPPPKPEDVQAVHIGEQARLYGAIRETFEIPDLSRNACFHVWLELNKCVEGLEIIKRMKSLNDEKKK